MPDPLTVRQIVRSHHSPAALWPVLSKTDWINRAVGLPEVRYQIKPAPEGGTHVTAHAELLGAALEWTELPFEWVEARFYRVRRIFAGGPFAELTAGLNFTPTGPSQCEVEAYASILPRSGLGEFLARRVIGPKTMRDMTRVIEHAGKFLSKEVPVMLPRLAVHTPKGTAFARGLQQLRQQSVEPAAVDALESLLTTAPDVEVVHMRPFTLARLWDREPWEILRLFLHATRAGLLNLAWEVLCPNCRSTRLSPSASLSEITRTSHCEVCNIQYDSEFDRSVELKFAVHPSIRPADARTFCLAGPGGRPHVAAQLLLEPNETRSIELPTITETLRLRSPQVRAKKPGANAALEPLLPGFTIATHASGFDAAQLPNPSSPATLRFHNPNPFQTQVVLERTEWDSDILTAARVTNWQEFRDLFASQIISPAEEITVGSQIVLFTDLRGSTALYNTIGDAPAYALVRDHFKVLRAAIADHHGAVVKTIGDAVMAVFTDLAEALDAVKQMHLTLPGACPGTEIGGPLLLKSALHAGPCLAVNANDRLDFFGTTINLAARLVDHCQGGDLTVTDDLYTRAETQQFIAALQHPALAGERSCRGFAQPVKVWRIPISPLTIPSPHPTDSGSLPPNP